MWGRKHSKETIEKLKLAWAKSSQVTSRPVKQINKDTKEVIKIWPSAAIASKHFSKSKDGSFIHKVCKKSVRIQKRNGKEYKIVTKTAYGFFWEFAIKEIDF